MNKLNSNELITIPQMAKRMKISKRKAYELKQLKGFPFYNFGERQTRVDWPEVVEWLKQNQKEKKNESVG